MNATPIIHPTPMAQNARTLILATLLVMMLCPLGSARAATVRYDYDESAAFSEWKTLAWKRPQPTGGDPLAMGRIRRALEAGFAAKGYTETDRDEADFLVDFYAGAHRELRLTEGGGPFRGRNLRVDAQPTGTLVVDVWDAGTGRLVWRGAVQDALANDPAKADRRTEKAVTELLAKFPPPEDR
jgi:hypothetical protein